MSHPIRIGRMGMLAVGLSIGAALAATPQVASADSSADPLSWADQVLSGLAVPAADAAAPLDMQISISGMDLFSTVDNTATANSGFGDIAIAIGNGANASATGFGDLSFADGPGSSATTGLGGLFDVAHRQRRRQQRRGRGGWQFRARQRLRRPQQLPRPGWAATSWSPVPMASAAAPPPGQAATSTSRPPSAPTAGPTSESAAA